MITFDQPDQVKIKLTKYIPHDPTPKQRAFLWLKHREALFGGAAGGGKSDALLMVALQYVDVPHSAALILRKTLADAAKPSSIMFRAREWLSMTDAVWDGQNNMWRFPSGAVLQFGRLSDEGDKFQYQGAEYQTICADEITQLDPADLDYVCNTRLRRPRCPIHGAEFNPLCKACVEYHPVSKVPLRIRTASNPGGKFHMAVKERYRIRKIPNQYTPSGRQLYRGTNPERPHIPSFIEDNPYLDQTEYIESLKVVDDPITREQLLAGNWGISSEGRFKIGWLRRYHQSGDWFSFDGPDSFLERELETFMILDPAASKENLPGREEIKKRNPSWTAGSVWSITPHGMLILRKAMRHQKEVPHTKRMIKQLYHEFPPIAFVGMELTTMSTHLYQLYRREGLNMKAFKPKSKDKVSRSVDATTRMEAGGVWYPEEGPEWLSSWEDEIFTWTGDPAETDDQVDCQCYASIYATDRGIRPNKPEFRHQKSGNASSAPSIIYVRDAF